MTKLGLDKPADAVADFDAALQLEPDHAATHEARGLVRPQKKWDEAKQSLSKAAVLVPRSPAAVLQRGRVNLLAGDAQGGCDAEAALKITPDMPEALLLRVKRGSSPATMSAGLWRDVDLLLERFPESPDGFTCPHRVPHRRDDRAKDALRDLERLQSPNRPTPTSRCKWPWCITARRIMRKRSPSPTSSSRPIPRIGPRLATSRRRLPEPRQSSVGDQRLRRRALRSSRRSRPAQQSRLGAGDLARRQASRRQPGRELAELACEATQYKMPHIISTLCAAHAEAGDFDGAKKWLLKELDLAADDDAQKDHLRKELASYELRTWP